MGSDHTETLRGQVESVRLLGRDAWGVMRLLTGSANETTEVVGTMLGFDIGDTIEVDGAFENHARYGRRFKAVAARVIIPTDASGVIAWLVGRMPAIGRRLATEMVTTYGVPGVWHVLEHTPEKLATLRGITPERAARIGIAYREHLGERDRIVAFKSHGLTDRQIAKIQQALGDDALDQIRRNPYMLIDTVDGFGWVKSDLLARRLGLPLDHPARIQAGLEFLLGEAAGAGHTYVPAGKLIKMGAALLGIGEDAVRREGRAAIAAGRMVQRESRVYSPGLDAAEQSVADSVRRLLGASADVSATKEGRAA